MVPYNTKVKRQMGSFTEVGTVIDPSKHGIVNGSLYPVTVYLSRNDTKDGTERILTYHNWDRFYANWEVVK